MTVENPTGDAGASISERLERFLDPESSEQTTEANEATEVETPETEVENTADDALTESEEPQVSISDVAQYLGVEDSLLDVAEDGSILVKTKIDGQEGTVKFNDLVKSYQLQGHVDAKAREAAELAKTHAERVQQFEAFAQQEAQKLTTLANVAYQELVGDFSNVNWQELARTDPAEYVAQKAALESRQAKVQQLLNAAQQQSQQAQQAQQERFQQSLQAAAERIAVDVPGWQPGNEVDLSLMKYAKDSGFTNTAEILATYPQAASIWHKAMLYDQGKAKASVVEKQVRQAPKLVKPGQSMDARQRAQSDVHGLKQTIRKSGGKQGIQEYLLRTGKV
jgi:hypothetical protein